MLLSIDIGTTNVKGVYYDANYEVVEIENIPLEKLKSTDIIYERDPVEILEVVKSLITPALNEVILTVPMHTLILFDRKGKRITGLITWNDKRGYKNIENLSSEAFYKTSGTPIHSMNPAIKLSKLLKDYPSTYYISTLKDYLYYELTGQWLIDRPSASATGLYNLVGKTWDENILSELNLSLDQLPKIEEVDYNTSLLNRGEVKIYLGATDGVASSYSVEGPMLSLGTSHAVRLVASEPVVDTSRMPFSYHIKDGEYLVGFPSNNGGNVVKWLLDMFNSDFSELDKIISLKKCAPPKAIFLPYLNGERAPIWEDSASCEFINLNRDINRDEILYSAVCGVLFNIKLNVESLRSYYNFNELTVSGGLTRMESLMQLLADVLEIPLKISGNDKSEGYGSLRLVGKVLQKSPNYKEIMVKNPNYLESYKEFKSEVEKRYKFIQ